ncbi:AAA family ATPase [Photobacterium salinisoli]|uniref:AAA family ATPase n=1 Tax=Photobacterium salinisoli TaxID=1616783 RepID=UPI000EA2F6DF|nr:AAA family ATPase [Photobacterium salinisoli]
MKLKKVEIQAFKSYLQKEDGTFDFTSSDSETPANFISLFAPNGFGKTSFFDAIDFAITKKITRYVRSDKLSKLNLEECRQHNTQGEKQLVIRNKNAPLNLKTIVRVSTDRNEKPFISSYKNSQKNSSDLRIQSKSNINNYFESSMLYQESIDAFLRETNSEDRFLKFSEIDGELVEINRVRTSILSVKSEISNEEEKLVAEKLTLEKEEKSQLEILNNVDEVNRIISELNKSNENIALPLISAPYNESSHFALSSRIIELYNSLEKNSKINKEEVLTLESQLSKIELAISMYQQYLSFKEERERIILLNSNISKLDEFIQAKIKLDNNIKDAESERIDLIQICEDAKKFTEVYLQKTNVERELEGHKKVLTSKSERLNDNKRKLSKLLSERVVLEKELSEVKSKKTQLNDTYDKISKLIKAERDFKLKFEVLNNECDTYLNKIKSTKEEMDEVKCLKINDVTKYLEKGNISQKDNNLLRDITDRYKNIEDEISIFDRDVNAKHQKLNEVRKQNSDVLTLIEKASVLISETQQSHCPLCDRPNHSYEELLARISKNSALSELEKSLVVDLNKLNDDKSKLENNLNATLGAFKTFISNYIVSAKREIDVLDLKKAKKEIEIINLREEFSKIKQEMDILNTSVMYMSKEEYNLHLDGRMSTLIQCVDELYNSAELLKKEIEYGNVNVDDINKLQDIENRLSESNAKLSGYVKLNEFITKSKLEQSSSIAEITELAINFITELDAKLAQYIAEKSKLVDAEKVIDLHVEKSPYCNLELRERNNKIHALQDDMDIIIKSMPWFFNILNGYDSASNEDLSTFIRLSIENMINDVSLKDDKNHKLLVLVSTVKDISEELIGYLDITEIQSKLRGINCKLKKLYSISIELENDSISLGKEISSRVDAFFNTDLINKIYQSIDPHPEYKEIIFTCTAEDKPKLLVSARSSKSNQLMSPTLSFSSAQINVLALSIFLARAINAKDDEENDVDCILIDDPVQSIDAINTLGLIDTLRMISVKFNKQIILTTHDENFHELLKKKIPQDSFSSKFLRLKSFGKVSQDSSIEES